MRLNHEYPTEKCKTVVREVLPRVAINQDQTFPDSGRHIRPQSKRVDVREEASVEERVGKNLKPIVRHLGSTEEVYGSSQPVIL